MKGIKRNKQYYNTTKKIRRGDIIWLKKGIMDDSQSRFGGSVQSFNRPYIVISNDINNKKAPIINVVCISTKVDKSKYCMHTLIEKEKYGLEKDSVVFAEQVMTIPKNYVHKIIGRLDDEDMKKVNKTIYIQMINEKCDLSLV